MVVDGVHDDLVAVQAAQAHGLGGMAIVGVEGGVQFRHGAAIRLEGLLEGPVGVDGVRTEHGHVGVQHGHGRAQTRHHGGILVVADFREAQQIQLNGLAGGLQPIQHAQALGQGPAAGA